MQLSSDQVTELGVFWLRPGASVVGWVDVVEGRAKEKDIEVKLTPLAARQGSRKTQDTQRLEMRAQANDRGFFHFDGVARGSYEIEATLPGYAPARRSPIEVLEGLEAELAEPLHMQFPRALEVRVEPVVDPWDRAWTINVVDIDSRGGKVDEITAPVDGAGSWRKRAVLPGRYVVRILDSYGNAWFVEELAHGGEDKLVDVALDLVRLQGEARLAGEPLAGAKLRFGRQDTGGITLTTGETGEFAGFLPGAGMWRVEVSSREPSVRRWLQVEVPQPNQEGRAWIDIDLESTYLAGKVVDEQNEPVFPAAVTLRPTEDGSPLVSEMATSEGTFVFEGLEPGVYELIAEAPGNRSADAQTVRVESDERHEDVELVVRRQATLVGEISSAYGTVVGARVDVLPLGPREAEFASATTDVQGWFEVQLPPATQEAFVFVFAPGYAARFLRVTVRKDLPLDIRVEDSGGRLNLRLPEALNWQDWWGKRYVVRRQGVVIPLATMQAWAQFQGWVQSEPVLVGVPQVEPGAYDLCAFIAGEFANPQTWDCVSGLLVPGGELDLDLAGRSPGEDDDTPNAG